MDFTLEKKANSYLLKVNDQSWTLEPEVVIKHHLWSVTELDARTLKTIITDHDLIIYDKIAARKMKIPRTVHEIRTTLRDHGASKDVTETLISRYLKYRFLDDTGYAKTYLETKQSAMGPNLIKANLKLKGLSSDIIDAAFESYDEDEMIGPIAYKAMCSVKGKSFRKAQESVRQMLLRKGFSVEATDTALNQVSDAYQEDETQVLKRTYDKLMVLYQKKKDADALRPFIIKKLMSLGFSYDDIKRLLD